MIVQWSSKKGTKFRGWKYRGPQEIYALAICFRTVAPFRSGQRKNKLSSIEVASRRMCKLLLANHPVNKQ